MSENFDFDKEYAELSEIIKKQPDNADGFFRMGLLFLHINDYDNAIENLDVAIELCQNNPYYYANRAFAKRAVNNLQGAINDCTFALSLNSEYTAYLYQERGLDKFLLEDYQGAKIDINRAIEFGLENEAIYYLMGNIECSLCNYKTAIEHYTKALEFCPTDLELYLCRARTKKNMKDYRGAIVDYNEALKFDSNNKDIKGCIKDAKSLLKSQEDYLKQIYEYECNVKNNPNDYDSLVKMGDLKIHEKDYDGALKDLTQAITIQPNCVEAYDRRALCYIWLDDTENAIKDFTQIIKILPKDFNAYRSIANQLIQKDDYLGAIEVYNKAIDNNVTNKEVFYYRAHAYMHQKMYKDAESDCAKCIKEKIGAYDSLYGLMGDSNYEQKNYQAAIKYYQYEIDLYDKQKDSIMFSAYNTLSNTAKFKIAKIEYELKNYNNAIKILDELIKEEIGFGNEYLLERGKNKLELNDIQGALKDFTDVINIDNSNEEAIKLRDIAISRL